MISRSGPGGSGKVPQCRSAGKYTVPMWSSSAIHCPKTSRPPGAGPGSATSSGDRLELGSGAGVLVGPEAKRVAIINMGKTQCDDLAEVIIRGKAGGAFCSGRGGDKMTSRQEKTSICSGGLRSFSSWIMGMEAANRRRRRFPNRQPDQEGKAKVTRPMRMIWAPRARPDPCAGKRAV